MCTYMDGVVKEVKAGVAGTEGAIGQADEINKQLSVDGNEFESRLDKSVTMFWTH